MPAHPLVASLGPHVWNDPRNKVEPLEPLMGCRPWERASEPLSHAACGPCEICRSRAFDPAFVCLGCLRVARTVQAKLTADRWPSTEPPKEKRPLTAKQKKKLLGKLTRKERRSLLFASRGTEAGEKWAESVGLKATA